MRVLARAYAEHEAAGYGVYSQTTTASAERVRAHVGRLLPHLDKEELYGRLSIHYRRRDPFRWPICGPDEAPRRGLCPKRHAIRELRGRH